MDGVDRCGEYHDVRKRTRQRISEKQSGSFKERPCIYARGCDRPEIPEIMHYIQNERYKCFIFPYYSWADTASVIGWYVPSAALFCTTILKSMVFCVLLQ